MKRNTVISLILCLCMLACACTKQIEPEVQPSEQIPGTTELRPIVNVVESPVNQELYKNAEFTGTIFVTTAERSRLYAVDEMGNNQILIDDYCMAYAHEGDIVVAGCEDGAVYRYDLSTDTKTYLFSTESTIGSMFLFDGGFAYKTYSMMEEHTYIYHFGDVEPTEIGGTDNLTQIGVIGDKVVALGYGPSYSGQQIYMYRQSDGSFVDTLKITDIYNWYAQNNRLYYSLVEDDVQSWMEADLGMMPSKKMPVFPKSTNSLILNVGEQGVLVYDSDWESGSCSIGIATEDGIQDIGIELDEDSWITNADEENGKILLQMNAVRNLESDDSEYYTQVEWYVYDSKSGEVKSVPFVGRYARLFEKGDFPVIDTSTARRPVTRDFYRFFALNTGFGGNEPLCSKTHGAWLNIADKVADVGFLSYPTEEEQAYLKEKNTPVDIKLYGGDGLVFIGGRASGVTNLSTEEIKAIYRGEITNWKELGGVDQPINVLYRNDQSGSQRIFEKLLWEDEEIPNFEKLGFCRIDEMSSIVNECLYDPYAIGYSIMTYLNDVYQEEDLQIYAVDGAEAIPENVANGTYPLGTQGYVVIRSDEPKDSPARRLFDWVGTPLSDDLLRSEGITPLHS